MRNKEREELRNSDDNLVRINQKLQLTEQNQKRNMQRVMSEVKMKNIIEVERIKKFRQDQEVEEK